VHRDLKEDNILIEVPISAPDAPILRIIDFGLGTGELASEQGGHGEASSAQMSGGEGEEMEGRERSGLEESLGGRVSEVNLPHAHVLRAQSGS